MPMAPSRLSVFDCVCEDEEGSATTCHFAPYDDEPCLPENVLPNYVRAVCGRSVCLKIVVVPVLPLSRNQSFPVVRIVVLTAGAVSAVAVPLRLRRW